MSRAAPHRVVFVNQHYWPDVASTGQHLTDLCEYLAEHGARVGVLTGRAKYTAGAVEAPARETHNAVEIVRVRGTKFGRGSHLGRIADYASFYAGVLRHVLSAPRDDRFVFLTTPPLVSFVGAVARAVRGTRYGVWSMDLHPEAEVEAGMLRRGSVAARALGWFSDAGYRRADFVVDLGAYMKRRITSKGVAPDRTHTVQVWSSKHDVAPSPRESNPVRRELGLDDRFVVMYSGNAGLVHSFADVLEAMRRMRDDGRVFFLFVGDGPRRREIEAYAREHALANFAYRPYFARERLGHSLTAADAHLITLRAPFVGVAVPGKLYGAMASGRPALFVGPARCESADAVRDARCGAVIDPAAGDAAGAIVAMLERWLGDPGEVARMGARGRAAFLERYEREPNCAAFERVLRECWDAPGVIAGRVSPGARPSRSRTTP